MYELWKAVFSLTSVHPTLRVYTPPLAACFWPHRANKFRPDRALIKIDKGVTSPAQQVQQNKQSGENFNQAQSVHTQAVLRGALIRHNKGIYF